MIALKVITRTLTATTYHSKKIITLIDHHENPVIIELDSVRIQDLINTHHLIPLNPMITQTHTLLLKSFCITKLLMQKPLLRLAGSIVSQLQNHGTASQLLSHWKSFFFQIVVPQAQF